MSDEIILSLRVEKQYLKALSKVLATIGMRASLLAELEAEVARLTSLEKGIAQLLIYKDGYLPITTDDALSFIKLIFDKELDARIALEKSKTEVARLNTIIADNESGLRRENETLRGQFTAIQTMRDEAKAEVARLTKLLDDTKNLIELNGHKSLNEMVILTRLKREPPAAPNAPTAVEAIQPTPPSADALRDGKAAAGDFVGACLREIGIPAAGEHVMDWCGKCGYEGTMDIKYLIVTCPKCGSGDINKGKRGGGIEK